MAPSPARRKDIPKNLKPYFLALFRPGARWNQTEGAEDLVVKQLAFLRAQFESGAYRAAGPVTGDGAITAIAIIEAESLEAAQNIVELDPAVVAERLLVEVHPTFLPALDAVKAAY